MKISVLPGLIIVLASCSPGSNENSAICGLTHLASANMVLNQTASGVRALASWPDGVPARVPARVVGYGSGYALIGATSEGVMAGFTGEGFPDRPGFGIGIVDDSSEVFRGLLIFDLDVPPAVPQLGGVAGTHLVIPLYAFRINWSSVNDPRCPLFAPGDSVVSDTP